MFSGLASYMNNLVGGQSDAARRQKLLDSMRMGTMAISYELNEVNFDHIRRKRAFLKGVNIQVNEEFDKEELVGFGGLPDILPMKPKEPIADIDYDNLMKSTLNAEEVKEVADSATPGPHPHLFDYDTEDTAQRAALLDRFELIRKRNVEMREPSGKPIAVIYNPYCSSGDKAEEIRALLFGKDIKHEIITCEANLDPFRKAFEIEIDNYSALIAVGGDGTFNQMVNGMLARPDQKHVPVGLIPTGQSNDMARSIGLAMEGITHAIETIAKGEVIAVDTTRVLLDHDNESSLPEGEERLQFCRHMMANCAMAMPARIANGADSIRGCFGSSSYSMTTYLKALSCGFVADSYNLTIDDVAYNKGDLSTALMMINNGKYSNGGAIMNPFACVNDGLIDITWIDDPSWQGTLGVTGVLSDARAKGGIQAYKGHSQYVRGRKIRIEVPQVEEEATPNPELELNTEEGEGATPEKPEPVRQVCMVDGEAMDYQSSITWECFPGNIEVFIDDSYFTANRTFERRMTPEYERHRVILQVVEKIWSDFDADHSGQLDKPETRAFLQKVLADVPPPNAYDEAKFEDTFTMIDKNGNGLIEKSEMVDFVKSLLAAV